MRSVAFRDFLRRIGLLPRRDHLLERGVRGARTAHRQVGEATAALRSPGAAHEPAAVPSPGPAQQPAGSGSAETVISPRALPRPSETPQPPPVAPAPPTWGEPQVERPPPAPQAAAGGRVDALGETRVFSAAGEAPLGQVVGVLVAVDGELQGTIRPVVSGNNRLGRHPECEVSLPSEWISRHHARIEHKHGIFVIEAVGDKPTIVNSEQIDGSELHDGDYIKVGKTTLRFRSIL